MRARSQDSVRSIEGLVADPILANVHPIVRSMTGNDHSFDFADRTPNLIDRAHHQIRRSSDRNIVPDQRGLTLHSIFEVWSFRVSQLDFGQKINGLAIVRGAKYGVREFLYCHG